MPFRFGVFIYPAAFIHIRFVIFQLFINRTPFSEYSMKPMIYICPAHIRIFICGAVRQDKLFKEIEILIVFIAVFPPYSQCLL